MLKAPLSPFIAPLPQRKPHAMNFDRTKRFRELRVPTLSNAPVSLAVTLDKAVNRITPRLTPTELAPTSLNPMAKSTLAPR